MGRDHREYPRAPAPTSRSRKAAAVPMCLKNEGKMRFYGSGTNLTLLAGAGHDEEFGRRQAPPPEDPAGCGPEALPLVHDFERHALSGQLGIALARHGAEKWLRSIEKRRGRAGVVEK